jgi:putative addiction module killer protein
MVRVDWLAGGNAGDVKPVGAGVSELRIDCGPGYRAYFFQRGEVLVVLLCGGDKRTQVADIKQGRSSWPHSGRSRIMAKAKREKYASYDSADCLRAK